MIDNPHAPDCTVELVANDEVAIKLVVNYIVDVDICNVDAIDEHQDVGHCLFNLTVAHPDVVPERLLSEVELNVVAQGVHVNPDEVVCGCDSHHVGSVVRISWVAACELAEDGHQQSVGSLTRGSHLDPGLNRELRWERKIAVGRKVLDDVRVDLVPKYVANVKE